MVFVINCDILGDKKQTTQLQLYINCTFLSKLTTENYFHFLYTTCKTIIYSTVALLDNMYLKL